MFCSKCGTENNDDSLFCNKCGNQLNSVINTETESNNTYELTRKKNMFTGFLLNIIAFALPTLMIAFLQFADRTTPESESSGGVSVSMNADVSGTAFLIAIIIGILIFGLGMAIYFIKNKKTQKTLSIVYLISAIADLTFFVMTCLLYVLATCGLGAIMFIPGILQVIAGTKFVSATKFNK